MPRKYFWFGFTIIRDDHSNIGTKWMDERCSKQVTLGNREYLRCDEVHVSLFTPNSSICSVDDLDSGRYSLSESAGLARYGADESAVSFNAAIPWRRLSTYGEPDEVVPTESGGIVSGVSFRWIDKWRDNYWVVNSGHSGKVRRTGFGFRDIEGRMHYFYAVPWFGTEFD